MQRRIRLTGISLLLVLLVSVCLFTFAGIVLASAAQSEKQAGLLLQRQEEYYAACSKAFGMIQEDTQEGTHSRKIPIGEDRVLCITYEIYEGHVYRILGWHTENTEKWEPDGHLELLGEE